MIDATFFLTGIGLGPNQKFIDMARQTGVIKLRGKIGDLSFYRSNGEDLARTKGGVDASRIQNDPAFERTRENGAEFGAAGRAGKLLRTALRSLLLNTADKRITGRITREMLKAIQADAVNARGQRNMVEGDATILRGFNFNNKARIGSTVFFGWTATVDRVAGEVTLAIDAMVPNQAIAIPSGATHARLVAGSAEIDFGAQSFVSDNGASADIALGNQNEAAQNIVLNFTAASVLPVFVVFGVEFYQEVNGQMYSLKNGAYNALALVEVDQQ